MSPAELLAANGNRWRVRVWTCGNRRRTARPDVFVRAEDRDTAIRIARRVVGRKGSLDAWPWDPRTDLSVRGFVQEIG